MKAPTPLPELNAVLGDFVNRCHDILGSNLVGAYLQGSFAVGDFTERSDVDFMIVVRSEIEADTLARLQQMHAAIHEQPSYWAKHLEGSYVPMAIIRKLTDEPRDPPGHPPRPPSWRDPETGLPPKSYPFLFLGNGANTLVRSEHDNSLVVRWVVRERGIPLFGPSPQTLLDSVAPELLRAEIRANLAFFCAPYLTRESKLDAVWRQAFFVTLLCRMLHTLETGQIHSKKAGTRWALQSLPEQWHALIEGAAASWAQPQETWHLPPDPRAAEETLAFMQYAITRT